MRRKHTAHLYSWRRSPSGVIGSPIGVSIGVPSVEVPIESINRAPVTIIRPAGYNGAVTLTPTTLPAGMFHDPVTVPAGVNTIDVIFSAGITATPVSATTISIIAAPVGTGATPGSATLDVSIIDTTPELPRSVYDPDEPTDWTGMTQFVVSTAPGEDLQSRINAAKQCGNPLGALIITPNAVPNVGRFTLPQRTNGTGPCYILPPAKVDHTFPRTKRQRVQPSDTSLCGIVQLDTTGTVGAFQVAAGATQWWILGISVTTTSPNVDVQDSLIQVGTLSGSTSLGAMPDEIVVAHCLVRGWQDYLTTQKGIKRGLAIHCRRGAFRDNYVDDIGGPVASGYTDGGSMWVGNSAGPLTFRNNRMCSGGINWFTGGVALTSGFIPSDITFEYNHLCKKPYWNPNEPAGVFGGVAWASKNLFEIKQAQRVLIRWNRIEYAFNAQQNGAGMLIKSSNQGPGAEAPYHTTDITIYGNMVLDVVTPLTLVMAEAVYQSGLNALLPLSRVRVEQNLFEIGDLRRKGWTNTGSAVNQYQHSDLAGGFMWTDRTAMLKLYRDLRVCWNTFVKATEGATDVTSRAAFAMNGNILGAYGRFGGVNSRVRDAMIFEYNVFDESTFGVHGDTSNVFNGDALSRRNWWARANGFVTAGPAYLTETGTTLNRLGFFNAGQTDQAGSPPLGYFVASSAAIGWVNKATRDYRLAPTSPFYSKGPGGVPLGANIDALNLNTAHCVDGQQV